MCVLLNKNKPTVLRKRNRNFIMTPTVYQTKLRARAYDLCTPNRCDFSSMPTYSPSMPFIDRFFLNAFYRSIFLQCLLSIDFSNHCLLSIDFSSMPFIYRFFQSLPFIDPFFQLMPLLIDLFSLGENLLDQVLYVFFARYLRHIRKVLVSTKDRAII